MNLESAQGHCDGEKQLFNLSTSSVLLLLVSKQYFFRNILLVGDLKNLKANFLIKINYTFIIAQQRVS